MRLDAQSRAISSWSCFGMLFLFSAACGEGPVIYLGGDNPGPAVASDSGSAGGSGASGAVVEPDAGTPPVVQPDASPPAVVTDAGTPPTVATDASEHVPENDGGTATQHGGECSTNLDCRGGTRTLCDTFSNTCVQCFTDLDCRASEEERRLCDTSRNMCVECFTDADCLSREYPLCGPHYRCVSCLTDADCAPLTTCSLEEGECHE